MKKVLIVVDNLVFGGVSAALIELLKHMDSEKYRVDLLVLHNHGEMMDQIPSYVHRLQSTAFFRYIDIPFSELKARKNRGGVVCKILLALGLKTSLILPFIRRERKRILKEQYDVEISYKDGFCTVFTYAGDAVNQIAWIHSDYEAFDGSKRYASLMHKAFTRAKSVIAVSPRAAKAAQNAFKLSSRPHVAPNLIDAPGITVLSHAFDPGYPSGFFHFVSVGRLAQAKGYERLLRVHTRLIEEGHTHYIHVIGDGEERECLERAIQEAGMEKSFVLEKGYQSNPFPYMQYADCLLMHSFYESFALVVIESLIVQTPVLSTEVANVRDALEAGPYGLVVDNHEEALYAGMRDILTDTTALEGWNHNIQSYRYNTTDILQDILAYIDGAADSRDEEIEN